MIAPVARWRAPSVRHRAFCHHLRLSLIQAQVFIFIVVYHRRHRRRRSSVWRHVAQKPGEPHGRSPQMSQANLPAACSSVILPAVYSAYRAAARARNASRGSTGVEFKIRGCGHRPPALYAFVLNPFCVAIRPVQVASLCRAFSFEKPAHRVRISDFRLRGRSGAAAQASGVGNNPLVPDLHRAEFDRRFVGGII